MIAAELRINNSTIYKFLKRYKQTGSIENKMRKGRPPKWTTRYNSSLSILVKKNRKATVRTLWQLFNENKVNTVCLDTIRVKLKGLGMIRRSLKKSEFISRRNRIKQIRFAKTFLNWTADDWKKVIFSDESQFVIEDPKRIKMWKKSGEKYNYHQHYTTSTQKSLCVMVWGCITGDGIGSVTHVKGTINSQKYVSVLESNFVSVISEKHNWQWFFFMEDNTRPIQPDLLKNIWKTVGFQKLIGLRSLPMLIPSKMYG